MPALSDRNAEPGRLSIGHFAASASQLGLLLLSIRLFALEASFGLVAITPVIFFGFCAHAWLPVGLKLPFFLALSLAAFFVVLGAVPGAILVGISLTLVGICHLPVRFALRVAILALAGGILALLLVGWIPTSWAVAVVPVVGAMFMFRSIIFLYDQRTEQRPASIWMRLSYFFLLPNVCFLLFPVVDYRTFQRTYYDKQAHRIHQRGIEWILRGIIHLLLYRVVYFYLTPTASEIQDLTGVIRFVVSSYLLYLRISGHFHLIVGLLHLFGFRLPETNRRYLFASSFTDCWRRINIYWTEFMKKIIYFPAFVRFRRRGMLFGMIAATALTFLATWLLHAYQWFWLHGSFPLATDGLFWGLAGVLALGATILDSKRSPVRTLGRTTPSWWGALRRSLRTVGVFCLICFTWSLWCSSSVGEWLATLSQARHGSQVQVLALIGIVIALLLVATIAQRVAHLPWVARFDLSFNQQVAISAAGALLVALLGHRPVQTALGPSVAAAMLPITADTLNARDRERMTAGYYERLVDREGFGRVAERTALHPDDAESFMESPLSAIVAGPLHWELPASRSEMYFGALVETNRWGMRDEEYARKKPTGTFRIAILGTCYEMGAGVSNEDVWEAITEKRLNRDVSPRTGLDYEILNFAVPAYTLLQQVTVTRERVRQFEPDVVIVTNHVRSITDYLLYLATAEAGVQTGIGKFFDVATRETTWPEGLAELLQRAHEEPDADWEARTEDWAFREIAAACAEIDAMPVLLNVPYLVAVPGIASEAAELRTEKQIRLARNHGYEYLDISSAFEGEGFESLAVRPSQCCPNATGHRLMSESFYDALLAKPQTLGAP